MGLDMASVSQRLETYTEPVLQLHDSLGQEVKGQLGTYRIGLKWKWDLHAIKLSWN